MTTKEMWRVTIYHQVGKGRFMEVTEDSTFEFVYDYWQDFKPTLDEIWVDNNTVDVPDYSYKNKVHSLSMGDGVVINPLWGDREAWVVKTVGWEQVDESVLLKTEEETT